MDLALVGLRVLGGVGHRLGGDEVGGGLDRRGHARAGVAVDRDRQQPGARDQRLQGGLQAAVGEDRRGDPAREVAQLDDRAARLAARLLEQLARLGGIAVHLVLGQAERHRQRDEPRLRAVVQVALDPAQLLGLGVDRAGAGARELLDAMGQPRVLGAVPQAAERDDRVHAEERAQADDRPDRPEVPEARQRPDDHADSGGHAAQAGVEHEPALDRVAHGEDGGEHALQGDRYGQAEHHPDRPEVAVAGHRPDPEADGGEDPRQRGLQRQDGVDGLADVSQRRGPGGLAGRGVIAGPRGQQPLGQHARSEAHAVHQRDAQRGEHDAEGEQRETREERVRIPEAEVVHVLDERREQRRGEQPDRTGDGADREDPERQAEREAQQQERLLAPRRAPGQPGAQPGDHALLAVRAPGRTDVRAEQRGGQRALGGGAAAHDQREREQHRQRGDDRRRQRDRPAGDEHGEVQGPEDEPAQVVDEGKGEAPQHSRNFGAPGAAVPARKPPAPASG